VVARGHRWAAAALQMREVAAADGLQQRAEEHRWRSLAAAEEEPPAVVVRSAELVAVVVAVAVAVAVRWRRPLPLVAERTAWAEATPRQDAAAAVPSRG
jgi:hypothetical protein